MIPPEIWIFSSGKKGVLAHFQRRRLFPSAREEKNPNIRGVFTPVIGAEISTSSFFFLPPFRLVGSRGFRRERRRLLIRRTGVFKFKNAEKMSLLWARGSVGGVVAAAVVAGGSPSKNWLNKRKATFRRSLSHCGKSDGAIRPCSD